jgi:predicted N-acetyltransferase YhbS
VATDRDLRIEVRVLRPGDDMDAQLDLAERSFGVKAPEERDTWRKTAAELIAEGRCLGAFAGDRLVGGAMFFDMRQWWCGQAVPMAGVASVRVAPEDRGHGVGRAVMTALLGEIAAQGYPLSVLYPATMPLYRSLGWELAGAHHTAVIPARSLFSLTPPDPAVAPPAAVAPAAVAARPYAGAAAADGPSEMRRAGPADVDEVLAVIGRVHRAARDCGPITWSAGTVGRWLAEPDLYVYLCADGLLVYRWHNGNDDLFVEGAEAISAATVRAFWSHVGSYGSIAEKVYAHLGPADAFWWLPREREADIEHRSMWMLRVVDAAAAITARGFPAAVSLRVPLLITDAARPANSGRWELAVSDGKGSLNLLTPGRPPAEGSPLTLGPRGLAAMYAGAPLISLRQAGLAGGGSPEDDAALDAAFAATSYMLDGF